MENASPIARILAIFTLVLTGILAVGEKILAAFSAVGSVVVATLFIGFSPVLQMQKAVVGIFIATLILSSFPFSTPSAQAAECKDGLELRGLSPDDEHHLKFFGKKETPTNRMQCREIIKRHYARQWRAHKCFDIAANPIARVNVNGVMMELLTDTGADSSHLSFEQASKARVKATGKKTFGLADGSKTELLTGKAYIAVGAKMEDKFPVSIGDGEGLLGNDVISKFACRR